MMKIAILGFGTVGSGTYEIVKSKFGNCIVDKILVRDIEKYKKNYSNLKFTKEFNEIISDNSIDLVIETIGGITDSYKYIKESLENGKHVITSNKAVVFEYFKELNDLANRKALIFKYEASVGGAIPIIDNIEKLKVTNEIISVRGILNGTTNYILTAMDKESKTYEDALVKAKDLGYAEQDPYEDVEGIDALRKIGILSNIVFEKTFEQKNIIVKGISNIETLDLEFAKKLGRKIKLVAYAKVINKKYDLKVLPTMLHSEDGLFGVEYAENKIEINASNSGRLSFQGQGAGKLATGSAVCLDIQKIISGEQSGIKIGEALVEIVDEKATYYIRTKSEYKLIQKKLDIKQLKYSADIKDIYICFVVENIDFQDIKNIFSADDVIIKIED